MLFSFDASSLIYFYDNYPMDNPHLRQLWEWFKEKVEEGEFVISKRAYDETVRKVSPEFIEWIKEIEIINDTIDDLREAQRIKNLLDIDEDEYHVKGVGENDIFIISISKRIDAVLVSNEDQYTRPIIKKKYKIPNVCRLPEVNVECINFTELLRRNP
jgi:hypothetical protein